MKLKEIIKTNVNEHIETTHLVGDLLIEPISKVSNILVDSLNKGGALLWCGNGGSAADSQHLAASIEVHSLRNFIETIRKIPLIMGDGLKVLSPDEIEVRNKLRIDVI